MSRNGSAALRLARQLAARGGSLMGASPAASAMAMPLFDVTGASVARLVAGSALLLRSYIPDKSARWPNMRCFAALGAA